jgi:hypothetical protein
MEEVWDIMNIEEGTGKEVDTSSTSTDEEILTLSVAALEGLQPKRTLILQGKIHNQNILILVDSGSPSTFINRSTTEKLQFTFQEAPAVTVIVANGRTLFSSQVVPNLTWWTQGHTFSSSARVLDIPYYDAVLGMDWLE